MTIKQFERKHPGIAVQVLHSEKHFYATARRDGLIIANTVDRKQKLAIERLSRNVLAITGREVMAQQGGRDVNTGAIGPLQAHHVKKRSAGGNHDAENLVGVGAETHDFQHHRRK